MGTEPGVSAGDLDRALPRFAARVTLAGVAVALIALGAGRLIEDDRLASPYNAMLVLSIGYATGEVVAWLWMRRRSWRGIDARDWLVFTNLFFCGVLAFLTYPAVDYQRAVDGITRVYSGQPLYIIDGTTHPPAVPYSVGAAYVVLRAIVGDATALPGGSLWYGVYLQYQLLQHALLAALFVLICRVARGAGAPWPAAGVLATLVLVLSHPLRDALGHNQPSVFVLVTALAALDLAARRPALAGVVAAAGTLVKLYPAVLVVEWVAAGRVRALLAAAVTVAAAVALAPAAWIAWLVHLTLAQTITTFRDASIHATAINGMMAAGGLAGLPIAWRLHLGRAIWLAAVAAIAAWMIRRALRARRDPELSATIGPELLAAAVLCFPLSWTHHYLFVIPLAAARLASPRVALWPVVGIVLALVMPAADVFPLGLHRIAGTACLLWAPAVEPLPPTPHNRAAA